MSDYSSPAAGRPQGQTIPQKNAEPHKTPESGARPVLQLRQELGSRLRELRRSRSPRLTGAAVAEQLGWAQSTVSRIEGAHLPVTIAKVTALLDLYRVSGHARTAILALAATVSGEGSWTVEADLPDRQQTIAYAELNGGYLRHFQPTLVPGALQIEDYARAVVSGHTTNVAQTVEARLRRQQALAKSTVRYEVVMDARVLLGGPADRKTRRRQALSLARPPASASWTVRVIPTGVVYPRSAAIGYTICDFADPTIPSVVWTEAVGFDVYHVTPDAVRSFADLFESVRSISLTAEESAQYLIHLADDL